MAFVLIQHLEPQHESALTILLSKATSMPVVEVSDGLVVQPDHVYVIPPNKNMTIRAGSLRLGPRSKVPGVQFPIDDFFTTLATEQGNAALGVVLSGTGSDGTQGLRAIKAAGGVTFAQTPKTAEWPAMPLSAVAAGKIAPNDSQRIQRALEVYYTTGRPISELQRATVSPLAGLRLKYWVLAPRDRNVLHERLSRRFRAMMAGGFLNEVKGLRQRGDLTARHPSMRSVGYRQLWAHLDGEYGLEEAEQRGIFATRQLAKRQLTWLRAEKVPGWLDPESAETSWNRDVRHELRELGL